MAGTRRRAPRGARYGASIAPHVIAVLALAASPPASSAEPVVLVDGIGEYPLGLHVEFLEDQDRIWSIEDVTGPDFSERFTPANRPAPRLGSGGRPRDPVIGPASGT